MAGCKLLVVQVAGLGYDFAAGNGMLDWEGLSFQPAESVFPAVTCTVQASFRTASLPSAHGMVANGLWDDRFAKARFWEQSSRLVEGPRIWDGFRNAGGTVGMLFWQQSMGENVDALLSPAPIHKHHGGMIQDCYSRPEGLYDSLRGKVGRAFNLMHYWGPMASQRSSAWIADATVALLENPSLAPDVCFTYLPVLDYDLQRYGTDHPRSRSALAHLGDQLHRLKACATSQGYELLVFGDYALADVTRAPALPNVALRRAGLLKVRAVKGTAYPDLTASRAFVMADHEIGHVFVPNSDALGPAQKALEATDGIGQVVARHELSDHGLDHRNSGDLVVIADEGSWIAYPWWEDASEAPEFAGHVDIHNKPGYDPCELFWGWPPGSVSGNLSRVHGTHGCTGPTRRVAWAATFLEDRIESLVELGGAIREWLGKEQ